MKVGDSLRLISLQGWTTLAAIFPSRGVTGLRHNALAFANQEQSRLGIAPDLLCLVAAELSTLRSHEGIDATRRLLAMVSSTAHPTRSTGSLPPPEFSYVVILIL